MAETELPNPKELEEISEKKFHSRVAMITAIYAVVLAVASLGGNHAMKEMLLAQQQASDQWAYYQAKSIREHLYRSQRMLLENQLALLSGTLSPQAVEKARTTVKTLGDEESRFASQKKEIMQKARELEKERDKNRSKDPDFEYAEVLLQIAIIMASVAIIADSRALFSFSVLFALIGAFMCTNGYLQVLTLPLIH